MSSRINRTLRRLALCLPVLAGCSGGADPKPADHACFRALDCQPGLVCVEGRCTSDIGPLVPEGAGMPAEIAGSADAGQ